MKMSRFINGRSLDSASAVLSEIGGGSLQALIQLDLGRPIDQLFRQGSIGSPLGWIILGQRLLHDTRCTTRLLDHLLGELANRELPRVTEVHGAHLFLLVHHADHAVHQVVHVAEGSRLGTVTVHGQVLSPQCLYDKVGNHSPIVRVHPWTIGVEDANHPNVHTVLPVVIEEQGLRAALALVVASPRPNGINVAPVGLGLRMHVGVPIHLGSRGLQDSRFHSLRKPKTIYGSHYGSLHRLDRVELVVNGRGRTGEVVDLVHLGLERIHYVVAKKLEARVVRKVGDVSPATREEVVQAQHLVPFAKQTLAKVTAEKTGSTRY